MPRLAISNGASFALTVPAPVVKPDWWINVTSADLAGNVTVVLPNGDPAAINRPTRVHVVYYPGALPAGATPESVLAAGPNAVADAPPLAATDVTLTLAVTLPTPLAPGLVTVVAVGEFAD